MLGPACVLVARTPTGFRSVGRDDAAGLQKSAFEGGGDRDWLFSQCRRIADALGRGQVALAQIYGLRIPVGELDDLRLRRIALSRIAKVGFDPDEPRLPQGDPHGGEWTSGGDGSGAPGSRADATATEAESHPASGQETNGGSGEAAPPLVAYMDTSSGGPEISDPASGAQEAPSPGTPADTAPAARPAAPSGPAMQYRFVTPEAGAGPAADASQWLLGDLAPTTETALRLLITRLGTATIVFGILFIPTNRSPILEGAINGAPDLSYRYDEDTGTLQIRQSLGSLGAVVLSEARIDADGRFRDAQGNVIGRYLLGSGAVINAGAPADYQAPSNEQQDQPRLCPSPSPENIAGRSERSLTYQEQISGLPRGLEVTLNGVRFDGCIEADGTMLEAKGPGFEDKMSELDGWKEWFTGIEGLEDQMRRQNGAAAGRAVEWHFAEEPVADFFRRFAEKNKLTNIVVIFTPPRRP